jgi:hypothetical protein
MFEVPIQVISDLAMSALYDLVKSGFHKIYENIKLVLGRYNVDDETIKLVHVTIKDLDKNAFICKETFQSYVENKMFPKIQVRVSKSPNAIVINQSKNVTINVKKEAKDKKHIFEGTIGANYTEKAYIKYLIDRYHEFKKAHEKDEMNYSLMYTSIKREFKIKWDEIPSKKFHELTIFLQKRINTTIVGKQQKSNGYSSFKTYDEFCSEHL